MGRSVVLAGAARCPRRSLPPRWCTCYMLPPFETRVTVQVLIHRLEQCRPSSTGKLVGRAVAGARKKGTQLFSVNRSGRHHQSGKELRPLFAPGLPRG